MPQVFCDFFLDKVIKIRNGISFDERTLVTETVRNNVCGQTTVNGLHNFTLATEDEIKQMIMNSSPSTCDLDPMPTWLLKSCCSAIVPTLTVIVNLSLANSEVPTSLKNALVRPLLKKANLDKDNLKNFRPVSNLSFLSKLIERIVAKRINSHLITNHLLSKYQSAYRMFHSTETALLRVNSDIMQALNNRNMVALVLLDLSAAFDTLDHTILLSRLESHFHITGPALLWIKSYLTNRTQSVLINGIRSQPVNPKFGVPQGSVLGPVLFTLYVSPLSDIANQHDVMSHFYADDSQLYVSFKKSNPNLGKLNACINSFRLWMARNMLKLNEDKTELILLGSENNLKVLSSISVSVGDCVIQSSKSVKNLGAIFDSNMSMNSLVDFKVRCALFYLRNIARIRRFLTPAAAKLLIHAYVISRLDFMNSQLYGLPQYQILRLQRVQNIAARLIFRKTKYEHVTPLLKELHWLPIEKRILFKILVFVFKALNNTAPDYISQYLIKYKPTRALRSNSDTCLLVENKTLNSFGSRAFAFYAPKEWNSLPLAVRASKNLQCFKKQLKTYLFKQYYY